MKRTLLAASLLATTSVFAQVDLMNKVKDNKASDSSAVLFTPVVDLAATSVKNQANSGTCWSYATTSFVESEMIRMGKEEVDLSEMFTVRMVYLDKAIKYVRLHGHLNFAQGGALPDVLYVIDKYGAVPQEVYAGLNYGTDENKHSELESVLKAMLDQIIKNQNGSLSTAWIEAINGVLDAYLGEYPSEFTYKGKKYTPRTFADQVVGIKASDYVQLTSFTHAPFNSYHMIQVPDNWTWATAYNISLDELEAAVDYSLEQGYTVGWATDVSEKGFSYKSGLAVVHKLDYADMTPEQRENRFSFPIEEAEITQELRQVAYDNYDTQDDHGMQITGIERDAEGKLYYIVKNSWGVRAPSDRPGYIRASKAFFRYKTISVLVHKDSLPKALKKRI